MVTVNTKLKQWEKWPWAGRCGHGCSSLNASLLPHALPLHKTLISMKSFQPKLIIHLRF